MIEQTAIVVEKFDTQVHLEIERTSACGICGQTRGCGNATWGKALGHQSHIIKAENTIDAKVGDRVILGIEENAVLKAVYWLYVLPLFALFIGAGIATVLFKNELSVILGATIGLILGFIGVKKYLALQPTNGATNHQFSQDDCRQRHGLSHVILGFSKQSNHSN